ncbi:MAG: glycosyltransferase family 39 protein [Planctomycetes bacterium]|nr:glycosyltransferase family 39 protein [Planctomycetota bacterium]MCB9870252.1 glycosyltransferase family 39 protein [Planctomycetota bacterium]MCB9888167.1 glycosyltransferase family 39 protein [Planctomycetota bacterium]
MPTLRKTTPPVERYALLASLAGGALLCLTVPVFSQEAYYWTYAQRLDLSYFDHPPMVAWLIWVGTRFLGDGGMGIRACTLACALAVTLVGLSLLRAFGVDQKGRLAWIALGFGVPNYAVLHVVANPDPPLSACWGLSMLCLWRARGGETRWWVLSGIAAGLGLVSKYNAAFLAVSGLVLLAVDPAIRRQLRRPGPWLAVALACAVFTPVVVWNVDNHFASFRFQTEGRWSKAHLGVHWLFECAAGQLFVVNPGIALLVPFAVAWLWRKSRADDMRARWLLAFGLPMPLFLLASSLFVQVKINWFQPAYLPLLLGVIVWWREAGDTARPQLCSFARRCALAALCVVPLAPLVRLIPQGGGSSWSGWDEIAAAALDTQHRLYGEQPRPSEVFLFASNYKDSAQLGRSLRILCGDSLPGAVLAQNVVGRAALQFDHWEPPEAHLGDDAIFVLTRPDSRQPEVDRCRDHFASVEAARHVRVTTLGIEVLDACIFICRDYRGPR